MYIRSLDLIRERISQYGMAIYRVCSWAAVVSVIGGDVFTFSRGARSAISGRSSHPRRDRVVIVSLGTSMGIM